MATCRLTTPGEPDELLEADSARVGGTHTVLRGTAFVMGRPRGIVVRRAPLGVRMEVVDGIDVQGGPVCTAAELSDRPTRAPAAPDSGR